jgi:ubiquinone/menaquinone biosynthesis C-methylase UbiE
MEAFLNPNEILNQIKIPGNITAVDFGCGSGGWTIPLAKKITSGKIYAVDVLEEPISVLKARARMENILNIQFIIGNAEESVKEIKNETCDLVLMTNLLFQCDDKEKVLKEGKRVLRPGGRILVVDWKEHASIGPQEGRFPLGEVERIAKKIGLEIERKMEAGPYHYGIILMIKF